MAQFDSLARTLAGALRSSGVHPGLANEGLNMIGGAAGRGLAGLVRSFEGQGLGEVVQSWISRGRNLPITAEQITSVLGNPLISQLAAKLGIAPEEVAGQLTRLLPQLVDGLTPLGSLPDSEALQEELSLLRSNLG